MIQHPIRAQIQVGIPGDRIQEVLHRATYLTTQQKMTTPEA